MFVRLNKQLGIRVRALRWTLDILYYILQIKTYLEYNIILCPCVCVFAVSVCQAEEWVSERMQKMAEGGKMDLSSLQTKMKLLQKHQVFEAEILAHSKIINSVLLVRWW